MLERIERIKRMEMAMDKVSKAVRDLETALENYEDVEEELKELIAYYDSQDWRDDFEEDEKGHLPADLKRGVLSEDGVYNLLWEISRIMETMEDMIGRNTGNQENI